MDDAIDKASSEVTTFLKHGRKERGFVEHAIGSLEKPLTDAQLEAKFGDLAEPVIGKERSRTLIDFCSRLGDATNVLALTSTAQT